MRKSMNYTLIIMGLLLFAIGLFFVKTASDPQGIMKALPYVLVGLGCGVFGQGMGNVIARRTKKKFPEIEKQTEIERKDERNAAIANRAKSKAYDVMIYVYGALLLAFALMGTDTSVVLLLVTAYLFVVGCGIFYRSKYDKEM